MGVPRSGTTYFVNLMNSHPEVYCGPESYLARNFKVEDLEPAAFISKAKRKTARLHAQSHLLAKGQLKAIGNKTPQSYFSFNNVAKQMRGGTIFFCLRDPAEVFLSWDLRANDKQDNLWHAGMIWLIAYIEMIYSLQKLAECKADNIILINYKYLIGLESRAEAAADCFKFLGVDLTPEVHQFLEESAFATKRSLNRQRIYNSSQLSILNSESMLAYRQLINDITLSPLERQKEVVKTCLDCFRDDNREGNYRVKKIMDELKDNQQFSDYWYRHWFRYISTKGPTRELSYRIHYAMGGLTLKNSASFIKANLRALSQRWI